MAWIRTKITIPDNLKPSDREKLSDDIINFIQERSTSGYDKYGDKFEQYSKAYAAKKGVSRSNVDLILTGEMLTGLRLLSHKKGEVTIGYEKSSDINGRAEGNIKGTYGQSRPVTKPRDFLGIDEAVVDILAETIDEPSSETININSDETAQRLLNEIFGEDLFG